MYYSFGNRIIKEEPGSFVDDIFKPRKFLSMLQYISFLSTVAHAKYISNPNWS